MTDRIAAVPEATSARVFRMMLFVAGDEKNSRRARENLARLCDEKLAGRSDVTVVDVFEEFETAAAHGILVTPTLLVFGPVRCTVIGSLGDAAALHEALGIAGG